MRSEIFIQNKTNQKSEEMDKQRNKAQKDRCDRIGDKRRLNRFIQNKTNTKA
jgi:hypothetical protein